jgi:hypothetical protein
MKGLNISEEFGVILLGLATYDLLSGDWVLPWDQNPTFSLGRAAIVFLLLCLLIFSLTITHRANSVSADAPSQTVGDRSQAVMRRNPLIHVLAAGIVIAVLAFSLLFVSGRDTFLIWAGVGFINSGPWVERLAARV